MLSVRVLMELNNSVFPPVLCDCVMALVCTGLAVYAIGHIKDSVPHIEKRRGLSPSGQFPDFPPSFIHQVIIITRLIKLYNRMFSP